MTDREPPPPPRERKPYHAPKLVYLGSVSALTLGSVTTGPPDAKVTAGRRGA
jgi:hypothetical protein